MLAASHDSKRQVLHKVGEAHLHQHNVQFVEVQALASIAVACGDADDDIRQECPYALSLLVWQRVPSRFDRVFQDLQTGDRKWHADNIVHWRTVQA